MKKMRRGFTMIEVSLFLAITGVVFVGIAVGTQNSIFWQRYNDSVQSFAEFLRSEYSRVSNVQINGNKSDEVKNKAIYGRLVVFNSDSSITSYSVSGDANVDMNGSIMTLLGNLNAQVDNNMGITETFKPRWGSEIQTIAGYNGSNYSAFNGALLIVRHPSAGTIYTFVDDSLTNLGGFGSAIAGGGFVSKQVDFCVNPNGSGKSSLRKDVRIVEDARNASGVIVMPDGESACAKD